MALLVAGCWQLVILAVWGNVGAANSGGHNFTFPFGTYLSEPSVLVPSDGFAALRVFVVLLSLVTATLVMVSKPWTSRTTAFLVPALFIGAIAASSLGPVIVANFRNLGRATTEVLLLSAVAALGAKRVSPANWAILTLAAGGSVLALWDTWATTPL